MGAGGSEKRVNEVAEMKKHGLLIVLLILALHATGCQTMPSIKETVHGENTNPQENTKPQENAAIGTSDWIRGESPVPNRRIGLDRNSPVNIANGENGVYIMKNDYVYYLDDGMDILIPLCGRPDCTHQSSDCNAYVRDGGFITFYDGYLYAFSGDFSEDSCKIVRMDPDGSNHVSVIDLLEFAHGLGGYYIQCWFMTEGYCFFGVVEMVEIDDGDGSDITQHLQGENIGNFYYKIDGSAGEPKKKTVQKELPRGQIYSCGNTILAFSNVPQNGGEYGSYWEWHPETDTYTYLMDMPPSSGYFDDTAGYYHKDGAICRYTYSTGKEEIMTQTGLSGKYHLRAFPDSIVLFTSSEEDFTLYFYNWEYELVEAVSVDGYGKHMEAILIGETADRFLLSGKGGYHYITKSELGLGTAKIHPIEQW